MSSTKTRNIEVVARGLEFTEGPIFDRDGNFYVVEVAAGRITRIDLESGVTTVHAEPGGGPTGLDVGPDGCLYVANNGGIAWDGERTDGADEHGYGRLERIRPDGTIEELARASGPRTFLGPNDLVCDGHGGIWFTDPGHGEIAEARGRLCYSSTEGTGVVDLVDDYRFCNGLALRNEGRELIVAETGTGFMWIHDVLEPGVVGPRRPIARLPKGCRPDGLAVDEEGYFLVAGTFGGAINVFDPVGREVERIEVPDKLVTNLAFHPTEPFVCVTQAREGTVVRFDWDRPGVVLPGLRG